MTKRVNCRRILPPRDRETGEGIAEEEDAIGSYGPGERHLWYVVESQVRQLYFWNRYQTFGRENIRNRKRPRYFGRRLSNDDWLSWIYSSFQCYSKSCPSSPDSPCPNPTGPPTRGRISLISSRLSLWRIRYEGAINNPSYFAFLLELETRITASSVSTLSWRNDYSCYELYFVMFKMFLIKC